MKLCGQCKNREKKRRCEYYTAISNYAEKCKDFEEKKRTNADRIRSMSDEELAKLIAENIECTMCPFVNVEEKCGEIRCSKLILEWLQSEVEE